MDKGGHKLIQRLYDSMGDEYYSSRHKTIRYFNAIQTFPIRIAFSDQAGYLRQQLEDIDVLNIGVGNGQHCEQLCLPIFDKVFGERVRWDKVTDFDISGPMIRAASRYYPSNEYQIQTGEKAPRQVQGDVLQLPFCSDSFDIVLAGLCDHIEDQECMYEEVLKVLKPRGVFITTYPHKDLAEIIRRDIYGIDPAFTQFEIAGEKYLVPSYTPVSKEVEELFDKTGFEEVNSVTLHHDVDFDFHNSALSDTVRKAQQILGKRLENLPILVLAMGRKPDNLTKWKRRELEDPWFWYN